MGSTKPRPQPNRDTAPFWKGCGRHELCFQKCSSCSEVRWPPSPVCPECHSSATEWIVSAGRGRVYTFAVYHTAFHPAFEGELPYIIAVVELEEGPHLITNIVGAKPSEIECDMPVEVVWEDIEDGLSIARFRPVSAGTKQSGKERGG